MVGCVCLGRSGKLGKLSTSMRRKMSNDRPSKLSLPCLYSHVTQLVSPSITLIFSIIFIASTAVFGQPLTTVIDSEKTRGTVGSPTASSPPAVFPNTPPLSTFQNHPVSCDK